MAGENADESLLNWAGETFRAPVVDHWWQTGILFCLDSVKICLKFKKN